MAKPFSERLATALKTDRINCENLRELIAETEAEIQRQRGIQAKAEAESVDVLINESDRDEAAAIASRAARLVTGYTSSIEALRAKLAARVESDSWKSAEAEREAATAERDALVERWRGLPGGALEQLMSLFAATEANTARMRAANLHLPDAEAEARGVPGNYAKGAVLFDRFVKMRIPNWTSPGRAWPVDPNIAQRGRIAEEARQQRLAYERAKVADIAAAKEQEDENWSSYRVYHDRNAYVSAIENRRGRISLDAGQRTVLQMNAEQVAAARAKGLTVERELLGQPQKAAAA